LLSLHFSGLNGLLELSRILLVFLGADPRFELPEQGLLFETEEIFETEEN